MSVQIRDAVIHFVGACAVEEAELVAATLEAGEISRVDLSQCERLHAAVIQVLLRFRPEVQGIASDPFVREFVTPALSRSCVSASRQSPDIGIEDDERK